MSRVLSVAWREFKHTALTKAFIIGTVIFPLLIWTALLIVPFFAKPGETTFSGTVAMIDETGLIADAFHRELKEYHRRAGIAGLADFDEGDVRRTLEEHAEAGRRFGTRVRMDIKLTEARTREEENLLRDRLRAGEIVALAIIAPGILELSPSPESSNELSLIVSDDANPDHVSALRTVLSRAVVRARAVQHGMEVEQVRDMLRSPAVATRRLTDVGEAEAGLELQKMLPIVFMVLLWISAFASGNYLLTTTIEEKSNKVIEVLLSAVSPMELMAGKIIGQAIVGLVTIAVYAMLGLAVLAFFAMADLIDPMQIVYLIVFFFMAYFMVAAIMAGIGSAVSDLQEAHALITPAMLVLILPMILFMPISQDPNGPLATITTFIPPLTPFVMILRVTASDPVPGWQVILSIAYGYACVFAMIWMCARIFRVGILMQGKPPSPLELIRWMRYS